MPVTDERPMHRPDEFPNFASSGELAFNALVVKVREVEGEALADTLGKFGVRYLDRARAAGDAMTPGMAG